MIRSNKKDCKGQAQAQKGQKKVGEKVKLEDHSRLHKVRVGEHKDKHDDQTGADQEDACQHMDGQEMLGPKAGPCYVLFIW